LDAALVPIITIKRTAVSQCRRAQPRKVKNTMTTHFLFGSMEKHVDPGIPRKFLILLWAGIPYCATFENLLRFRLLTFLFAKRPPDSFNKVREIPRGEILCQ